MAEDVDPEDVEGVLDEVAGGPCDADDMLGGGACGPGGGAPIGTGPCGGGGPGILPTGTANAGGCGGPTGPGGLEATGGGG